jgi:hypothetical protein
MLLAMGKKLREILPRYNQDKNQYIFLFEIGQREVIPQFK